MFIENPDVFKSWLTSILEPLCDADPAALAKYVYALVKKDKPLEELREGMLDQLDVFLQHETKPFVDMLFVSLEGNDYLNSQNLIKSEVPEQTEPAAPETVIPEPPAPEVLDVETENHAPNVPAAAAPAPAAPSKPLRHRVVMRHKPVLPHEPTLVKVLPLNELLEEPLVDQPPRRRDRRSDSMRDKEERRRRRSRSWERRTRSRRHPRDPEHIAERRRVGSRSPSPRGRYRNRSPPVPIEDVPNRSRSRSPVGAGRERSAERARARAARGALRDKMSRDRDHAERQRSRDLSRDRSRSGSPRIDKMEHNDAYKRRCRDFDEKGYCMRGDLCEWDHGLDPVVLEDSALTRVLHPPPPEYNPLTPDIWGGAFPPHAYPPPHPPRELIPIPRIRAGGPPIGPMSVPPGPRHPPPNKPFDYNRVGAPRGGAAGAPGVPAGNSSLVVKKVPRGMNDIAHLNNHFAKFGKIVNIQVCYGGDPEAAVVSFSSHAEASVAYKSTEAVLNNRFIKVFWYTNNENKQDNNKHAPSQPPHQKGGGVVSQNKVLINKDNMEATKQLQIQAAEKQAKEKELSSKTEMKKESKKESTDRSKMVMEMSKRAQALLQTQLQQQMLLIHKLEHGNVSEPQKAALMEAINSAQEGIEKLQKELVAYNNTLKLMQEEAVARSLSRLQLQQANAKKPKNREEAQKEILDAELDMFTKQQEGQDVTELAKKIAELRRQMAINYPSHHAMRKPFHARGGRFNTSLRYNRAAAPPKMFVNQTLDHRPRAILISGFETDELQPLVTHFTQYGEVTGKEVNLSVPELVLQYKLRAHAELAMAKGRHYNDRTLSITWVANSKPLATSPVRNGDANTKQEIQPSQEMSEESLLRFDEEEDDEAEEDRSWRR